MGSKIAEVALLCATELSAPAYAGRLVGSLGGSRAAAYLEAGLKSAGFSVERMPVSALQPRLEKPPILELWSAGGTVIQSFVWRKDFRESFRGGYSGGSVRGQVKILGEHDYRRGDILLIPPELYNPADDERFRSKGVAAILLLVEDGSEKKKALAPGTVSRRPFVKLVISSDAYKTIASASSSSEVLAAYSADYPTVRGSNLIASWNGDGGAFKPRFLLLAHYDHVGTDFDLHRFPGALDNASGVGLALALAEAFAGGQDMPPLPADFALLLTDGEETGLFGAQAFAANPPFPLRGLPALNLDMVASREKLRLSLYSNGDTPSLDWGRKLDSALSAYGIKAVLQHPVTTVDSYPLGMAGAKAVTLCGLDQAIYHSTADLPARLDRGGLEILAEALYFFLKAEAKGR